MTVKTFHNSRRGLSFLAVRRLYILTQISNDQSEVKLIHMGRPRAYYYYNKLIMTFDDGCSFHPVPNAKLWNMVVKCGTQVCQANALNSIHVYAFKYILGCSISTCDEPILADLGLETLKYRRDFHKLKWHYKIKCLNDEKLQLNCWTKWRIKVAPRNDGLPMLILWGKNWIFTTKFGIWKLSKETLDRRECEEFEKRFCIMKPNCLLIEIAACMGLGLRSIQNM